MGFKEFIVILFLLFISVIPITYSNNDRVKELIGDTVEIDPDLLTIYEYLRRNEKEPVVVMQNISPENDFEFGGYNLLSAFTGHYPILSREDTLLRLGLFKDEVMRRRRDIKTFYSTDIGQEQRMILEKYKIAYVIDNGILKITKHLEKVKEATPFILYKVSNIQL
jgi:uncharacterized membrane protein